MSEKLTEIVTKALEETFNERQKLPFQYVVAYKTKDEKLIGYHLSTFCQITQNKEEAKRYSGENPYSQLGTIWRNISSTLKLTEEDAKKDGFAALSFDIKNKHFKGIDIDNVYIDAVYLDEDTPPQRFVIVTSEEKEVKNG